LKVDAIVPIATEDYPTRAKRPRNSRLALDRLQRLFGIIMPDWKQALDLELEEMTR
jgi:dTDP-4-dehydrorhamnose reductase